MHAIKAVCMNNPWHTSPWRKAGLDGVQSHRLCRTDFSAGMTERWGPVSHAQNAPLLGRKWVLLLGRNSLKVASRVQLSLCDAWAHMHAQESNVSLCNTLPHTSILLHLPMTWIHLVFLSRNFALILKHPLQYLRTRVNKHTLLFHLLFLVSQATPLTEGESVRSCCNWWPPLMHNHYKVIRISMLWHTL